MLIFARIAIDLVGRLIQLVPAEGNIVLNGGCRSVSEKTYITTVRPMDSYNLSVTTYWPTLDQVHHILVQLVLTV